MGTVSMIFSLLGGLGLFLYGMRVMSDALSRSSGDKIRRVLQTLTRNRVCGVLTGMTVTSIIQSSSATTVLLVSLVNASLVSLEQAIGVIMGANIGTTMTGWIVSLVGFKFQITAMALPSIALGLPLFFSRNEKRRQLAEVLIGFGVLFLGLGFMKDSIPDIGSHAESLAFLQHLTEGGFFSTVLFVIVGALLTIVIQSSSAAMAITLTMAYRGWIDFPIAAAIVLGENIGTTVTAYLASLGLSANARRAARVHTMFNVLGVFWMLAVFHPFLGLVERLVPGDIANPQSIPIHLAAFHSLFNVTNTLVLIGFTTPMARLARRLVHDDKAPELGIGEFHMPHISVRSLDTIEADLIGVADVVGKMAVLVHDMLAKALRASDATAEHLDALRDDMKRTERYTDQMQDGITEFLTDCMQKPISEAHAHHIAAMQRVTSELESMADSAYRIVQLYRRKARKNLTFHEHANEQLDAFIARVLEFLRYNADYLTHARPDYQFQAVVEIKKSLDRTCKELSKITRQELTDHSGTDVGGEMIFIDLIRHLERIGDRSLNVAEAIRGLSAT